MTIPDRIAALCEELDLVGYTENLRAEWGHEISVSDRAGTRWQTTAETLDGAVEHLAVILALHQDGAALRDLRARVGRTHHTRFTWGRDGVELEAWRRGERNAVRVTSQGASVAEAVTKLLEVFP